MKAILSALFLTVIALPLLSQEDAYAVNRLGLKVEYGMGGVAVKDLYISKERYSGTLPYFGVWYSRLDERKGFQVGLTYQKDDDLENYAIRASFSSVSVNFDQFYPVWAFSLAGKPAAWHIGPAVEYFEYELINRFSSTHKVMSELIMVSMGFNTLLEWRFSNRFTASFFLRSNVIGVNYKTHDELHYPDKNSSLQTLFTANNLNADLAVRYRIFNRVSLGISGKAQYTRSNGWDESRTYVNSLIVFAMIHF